jgi:hypothetical protein
MKKSTKSVYPAGLDYRGDQIIVYLYSKHEFKKKGQLEKFKTGHRFIFEAFGIPHIVI